MTLELAKLIPLPKLKKKHKPVQNDLSFAFWALIFWNCLEACSSEYMCDKYIPQVQTTFVSTWQN